MPKNRKQKIITYEFVEGGVQFSSSMKIKCAVTGKENVFYHSYLAKLIKKKYRNSWERFKKDYVSREGKRQIRGPKKADENEAPELNTRPELYRQVLLTQYRNEKDAIKKEHVRQMYERRYRHPIKEAA